MINIKIMDLTDIFNNAGLPIITGAHKSLIYRANLNNELAEADTQRYNRTQALKQMRAGLGITNKDLYNIHPDLLQKVDNFEGLRKSFCHWHKRAHLLEGNPRSEDPEPNWTEYTTDEAILEYLHELYAAYCADWCPDCFNHVEPVYKDAIESMIAEDAMNVDPEHMIDDPVEALQDRNEHLRELLASLNKLNSDIQACMTEIRVLTERVNI